MDHNRLNSKRKFALGKFLALFLMMLLPLTAFAQTKVTGTVTDTNGEAVIGASIKIKGVTGVGAVTDMDGNYTINAKPGQTLEFSYIGYAAKTAKVPAGGKLDIVLSEDAQTLNDVVVVGYGVMKRSDLTGSVASIDEKAIKQGVNTSLEQSMQGRIAGVQVTQNSGAPGGGISVQIRGINSFNGNEPLYVIDGIAVSGNSNDGTGVLSSINPSDITSIEVLKDASATAIYGSRASNGVVLVTTKHGQDGKAQVSYDGYIGWQSVPKFLDVMNLKQFAEYYNDLSAVRGYGSREDFQDPSLLTDGTNWQKSLFQTAFMQNHAINVSGGNKDMHYSISGGYLDQDGVGVGSDFKRASFRANFDTQVNKWIQFGFNTAFANTKQTITFSENNVISTALSQLPDVAARNPDGSYGVPENNQFATYYSNPLFEASMREDRTNNYSLDYNAFANITPIKGLSIRIEYGGNRAWYNSYKFQPDYSYGDIKVKSESTRGKNMNKYTSFKQYATYDFDPFKNNHFQIMLGHEAQWGVWESLSAGRKNYLSDTIHSLNVGDSSTATNSGDEGTPWAIESYFGRINYNLMDRYMVTATLRTDGSSAFGKDNRWGWFPSAALAWRISNEKFMKNIKWIDNMKLRLGWGLVGNQGAGSYAYGESMRNISTAWGTGYYLNRFPNYGLKWESTNSWNVGMDFSFLNNRIEFIVDAYIKKTNNLLMEAALPSYVINNDWQGISAPWTNAGSMQNKGIEFTLNTVNISKGDWQWRTGATLSINRNKLVSLNSDDAKILGQIGSEIFTISQVGQPVGQFYGYNVIGMYKTADDFYQKNAKGEFLLDANGNKVPTPRPECTDGSSSDGMQPIATNKVWIGDYIFEDVNGDGKISAADRKVIGDPNPDFTFGLNNTISWKNLEFSFFLNGSVGGDIYNYVRQQHTDPNVYGNLMTEAYDYARLGLIDPNGSSSDVNNVYVTNPTTAKAQRLSPKDTTNDNNRVSSRFVENGSYLRLKNISLSWSLPKKWLTPLQLSQVQVYGTIQNLFTICGYDGYDPEVGAYGQSVLLQGVDNYRYPSQRIYTLGLKVKF